MKIIPSNTVAGFSKTLWTIGLLPLWLFLELPTGVQAGDFQYTTNNGTISVTGYSGTGGVVTIVPSVDSLPVTSIGDWVFYWRTSLTSISLPDSLTNIGNYAFGECSGLTQVTIPPNVSAIGNSAFFECSKLTSITIPSSVRSIGDWAFAYCSSLPSITIGSNVTNIGNNAFANCTSLTGIIIPASVSQMGSGMFFYCPNLSGVYFLGNVPLFDAAVFETSSKATVYYAPATSGWTTNLFSRPTQLLTTTSPTLSLMPGSRSIPFAAGTTMFQVMNAGGWIMSYTVAESESWLKITGGSAGINNGTIMLSYDENPELTARTGTVTVTASGANGSPRILTITQRSLLDTVTEQDFNADGISDLAVFDVQGGYWYIKTLAGQVLAWANQWGWNTAKPVPGDYDGDGKWDQAIFDTQGGYWYIQTLTGTRLAWKVQWGWNTAKPVPGDYDGDGVYDLAVFDTQGGYWYIQSLAGKLICWKKQWGWSTAIPVPGDYDGDGKFDLAVYDTLSGNWYIQSVDGTPISWAAQCGWSTTVPVPGDYDGDGKYDLAVFDTVTGNWNIRSCIGSNIASDLQWGWRGGKPIPGDYDGDKVSDLAVFDSMKGLWYIKSLNGNGIVWAAQWGSPNAQPAPNSIGVFYPNFLFGVDQSTFSFKKITLTNLKTGVAQSSTPPRATGVVPGNYKVVVDWSGRTGGSTVYWTAQGTFTKTFTAEPGRDYQAVLSGGSWNIPWYTPPTLTIKSVSP